MRLRVRLLCESASLRTRGKIETDNRAQDAASAFDIRDRLAGRRKMGYTHRERSGRGKQKAYGNGMRRLPCAGSGCARHGAGVAALVLRRIRDGAPFAARSPAVPPWIWKG